jgi:hypothetical protein
MMEGIFLLVMSLGFLAACYAAVKLVPGRAKVFAVFILNCVFLCLVFALYEHVARFAGRM